MLRYSPAGLERFEQAHQIEIRVAGAESNVAIACARLGLTASWISRLTNNFLGRYVERSIAWHGVDTSSVVWTDEDRMGTYYVEFGAAPRPIRILYDRDHSAFSRMVADEIDYASIRGANLFHVTGITPALSGSCEELTLRSMQEARTGQVLVSFDVNYRSNLWSATEVAHERLAACADLADVLFMSESEARDIFQLAGSCESILRSLHREFPAEAIVLKLGQEGALALCKDTVHRVDALPCHTVDPIGTGDAFAAGFIYGYLTGDIRKALDYGAGLAALKRTIPGDIAAVSRVEVEELLEGDGALIQR
jgi:2-dehydro-3-deoxygluconokinase